MRIIKRRKLTNKKLAGREGKKDFTIKKSNGFFFAKDNFRIALPFLCLSVFVLIHELRILWQTFPHRALVYFSGPWENSLTLWHYLEIQSLQRITLPDLT